MLFKKFQMVAQIVGCVTIALLAIYGLLMVLSGDSPVWAAIGQPQAATLASQDIPSTFNYQGFLREPDGSLTTGSYTITARIYDLAATGTALYTTTVPNVTVQDGLFNIVLGEDPLMSAEAFADVPRYIGISLDDDPELTPRQRVHAVPWALTAKTLVSNAVVDGIVSTNDISISGQLEVWGNENVVGPLWASYLGSTGDAWVSGTLEVWGKETVDGPLWASYLGSTSDVIVTALRQIGDGGTGEIVETGGYTMSLRRYVLEATYGPDNSVPLDHAIVTDLCADFDGCILYLAERSWTTGMGNRLKTIGPFHFTTTSGAGGEWSFHHYDGNELLGKDGDSNEEAIANGPVWGAGPCYLDDFQVSGGVWQDDALPGFWWRNGSGFSDAVCVLIIDD